MAGQPPAEQILVASSLPTAEQSATFHKFMVCGNLFECPAKYKPIKPIGKGAYGVVCSARNELTGEKLAIKKIGNAFDNAIDARRTLREIRLLRHMSHENVITIKDILPPSSLDDFKDVYLVYELMDTDLHQIIRSSQGLSDEHCQYFIYQVLRGLKYIHSANILHRDLKPSNLLLNANCDLKICDFGLARTNNEQEFMTEYVVTRWYRAPELLLSCSEYTAAIDVWSVGCILGELLGRKPLFPGKDYIHQLNLITRVIGTPADADLCFISSDKARRYICSLPTCARVPFKDIYPNANLQAVDLMERMLVFEPGKRISVARALEHPYLASLHDINDEPSCPSVFAFPFDTDTLSDGAIRGMILEDVRAFNPEPTLPPLGHCATAAPIPNGPQPGGAMGIETPANSFDAAELGLKNCLRRPATEYDGLTFASHMVAGAVAGICEHVGMYPVDTIKTRMQALAHPGQRLHGSAVHRALAAVVKREGLRGLYGGVWAVAWSAGPAHALYFATYEAAKDVLGGNQAGHHPFASGAAGALATVVNDAVMTPADVVKQRLQVARSPYHGIADCVLRVTREEGISAFFRSYRTTLVMNVPFTALHFATYESAKKALGTEEEERLGVQLVAGGLAGGAAAGLTTPLDVVKTRLQLEGVNSATRYSSSAVVPTLRRIWQDEGARALWRGVQPRMLFHVPAAAICWGAYESMKRLLGSG
ncbi:hypothetical protein WJX72_011309 [[Myrmecia] bisecta]|uniref:Mitogen-activated protein kinase n=1 Tax=[Myrmecia] bisecta TaxID=41462 RepID=A0AAW1PXQ7_9CHLO